MKVEAYLVVFNRGGDRMTYVTIDRAAAEAYAAKMAGYICPLVCASSCESCPPEPKVADN